MSIGDLSDSLKLVAIKTDLEEEILDKDSELWSAREYAKYLAKTFFTKPKDPAQLELDLQPPNCS